MAMMTSASLLAQDLQPTLLSMQFCLLVTQALPALALCQTGERGQHAMFVPQIFQMQQVDIISICLSLQYISKHSTSVWLSHARA